MFLDINTRNVKNVSKSIASSCTTDQRCNVYYVKKINNNKRNKNIRHDIRYLIMRVELINVAI